MGLGARARSLPSPLECGVTPSSGAGRGGSCTNGPQQHPLAPWGVPSPSSPQLLWGRAATSILHLLGTKQSHGEAAPGTARALCNAPALSWLSLIIPRLCPDLLCSTESSCSNLPGWAPSEALWKTLAKGSAGISSEKRLLGLTKWRNATGRAPGRGWSRDGSCCPPRDGRYGSRDPMFGREELCFTSSPSSSEFWLGYEYLHHQV